MVGHCDGVWVTPPDKENPEGLIGVVDFKTINDNGYKGAYLELPMQAHVFQLHCYAFALSRVLGRVDFLTVLYENKNTQDIKEFSMWPNYSKHLQPLSKAVAAAKGLELGAEPGSEWRSCASSGSSRPWRARFAGVLWIGGRVMGKRISEKPKG